MASIANTSSPPKDTGRVARISQGRPDRLALGSCVRTPQTAILMDREWLNSWPKRVYLTKPLPYTTEMYLSQGEFEGGFSSPTQRRLSNAHNSFALHSQHLSNHNGLLQPQQCRLLLHPLHARRIRGVSVPEPNIGHRGG